jgi:hypothetical protein
MMQCDGVTLAVGGADGRTALYDVRRLPAATGGSAGSGSLCTLGAATRTAVTSLHWQSSADVTPIALDSDEGLTGWSSGAVTATGAAGGLRTPPKTPPRSPTKPLSPAMDRLKLAAAAKAVAAERASLERPGGMGVAANELPAQSAAHSRSPSLAARQHTARDKDGGARTAAAAAAGGEASVTPPVTAARPSSVATPAASGTAGYTTGVSDSRGAGTTGWAAAAASSAGSGIATGALAAGNANTTILLQMVKSAVDESQAATRAAIRAEVQNLHLEVLRQFTLQQAETTAMMEGLAMRQDRIMAELLELKRTQQRQEFQRLN